MKFEIEYLKDVQRIDIPALSKREKLHIKSAIENKLATDPEVFGKPLRRSLKGYRKLRVGDYRVIFRIQENTVKIIAIAHRSIVYKRFTSRF